MLTSWFKELLAPRRQGLRREVLWVGCGQLLAAVGALVGVRLLTSVLAPVTYGEVALGMTLATLTQQFILFPLSGAFLRFFPPAQEARELAAYLRAARALVAQATVLVGLVGALLALTLWLWGQIRWLPLLILASCFALFSGYGAALEGIQNGARQRLIVAWHQSLGQWLRFALAMVLVLLLGATSITVMLGYVLASAIVLVSQFSFLRWKIPYARMAATAIDVAAVSNWRRQMRHYSWPFATWGLFTWGAVASERWALQFFVQTSDVGLYTVLYQVAYYPVILLAGAMSQLVSPVLFGLAGDASDPARLQKARSWNQRLVLAILGVTALATTAAFGAHSYVFGILVALEYRVVSPLMPWLVLSGGLFAAGQAATLFLLSSTRTQKLIAPKITTAIFGILFNFAGAYLAGLEGVVLASLAFSALYFVWIMILGTLSATSVTAESSGRSGKLT
jgi:O-antigen/teichoic acid export membrane protein